jgi:hypothetical protein
LQDAYCFGQCKAVFLAEAMLLANLFPLAEANGNE